MASLNNCQFIGNIGRDPEVKYMPSGDAACSISIAVTESWKDKGTGEKKEKTEWIPLEFFGKLAEIVGQYCKKGTTIYVQGRFSVRKYTDKDGVEKYATTIKCDQMQMLGGKPESASAPAAPQQRTSAPPPARTGPGYQPAPQGGRNAAPPSDDIPF